MFLTLWVTSFVVPGTMSIYIIQSVIWTCIFQNCVCVMISLNIDLQTGFPVFCLSAETALLFETSEAGVFEALQRQTAPHVSRNTNRGHFLF